MSPNLTNESFNHDITINWLSHVLSTICYRFPIKKKKKTIDHLDIGDMVGKASIHRSRVTHANITMHI